MTIVSNNNEERVKLFQIHLKFHLFFGLESHALAFHKALTQMGMKKEEAVVIGDQLLTDVLGGNRGGFHTILVVPVAKQMECNKI